MNYKNHSFLKLVGIIMMILSFINIANAQDYKIIRDINYYDTTSVDSMSYKDEKCKLDLYYPKEKKDFPTIVWFHGGGLVGRSKEIPEALMDKGFAIVGVGYRLSPKVKAPSYIEDAAAAVAWVYKHIEEYGGNRKLVFVSGHSAGAYLGMMITLDKKYLNKFDVDADSIAELIAFSGQAITHFTIRKERGMNNKQLVIDEYAPLYHIRGDAPPILLITGDSEKELLGRYEENAYLYRMMKVVRHKEIKLYELDGYNHINLPEGAFPLLINEVSSTSKSILRNQ